MKSAEKLVTTHFYVDSDESGRIGTFSEADILAIQADCFSHMVNLLKSRLRRGDNMADMSLETKDIIKLLEAEAAALEKEKK